MKNALDPVIRSAELQLGILPSTSDRTCRPEGRRYTIFHQPARDLVDGAFQGGYQGARARFRVAVQDKDTIERATNKSQARRQEIG